MKNELRILQITGSLYMALIDGNRDALICQFNFNAQRIKDRFTGDFQFNFTC